MPTLLAIQSYPAASERLNMLWPWYELTGWQILGIDCEDGQHPWPKNTPSIQVGKVGQHVPFTSSLAQKFVVSLKAVFEDPKYADVTDLCLVESDGMFLRKPPIHAGGIVAPLTGWCPPAWNSGNGMFCHCPWWMDRETGLEMIRIGQWLIDNNEVGNGSTDIFVGKIIAVGGLRFTEALTWSCNGGGLRKPPSNMVQALKAVRNGVWFLHGIRTKDELDEIVRAIPQDI
jgi:hypothetical protein